MDSDQIRDQKVNLIGKRVKILYDHPHSGEIGEIIRVSRTAIGRIGVVVKLEDCPHMVEECFVFSTAHLMFLG